MNTLQTLNLSTDLMFATAADQQALIHSYIEKASKANNSPNIIINLAQVKRSDSAGLALMIDALRQGYQLGKKIIFEDIPEQMMSMIYFCNLSPLFVTQGK